MNKIFRMCVSSSEQLSQNLQKLIEPGSLTALKFSTQIIAESDGSDGDRINLNTS